MDERKMIYLEDAIKAVCDEFTTVYCYNCANQESEDQCEWCHRKSMNWSVSRNTVKRILNNLPSAQPEPQWIPCSKRLPKEEDGRVLITLDGEVTTAIYSEFSKTWYIGDMCGVSNRVPTAWMPRPKPYRSKKNEQ